MNIDVYEYLFIQMTSSLRTALYAIS